MCENFEESRREFNRFIDRTTDALTSPEIVRRALELEHQLYGQN